MATAKPKKKRQVLTGKFRTHEISGIRRGEFLGEELRQRVREACLDQFKQMFGFEWNPIVERQATHNQDPSDFEGEAQEVWKELRAAMTRAVEFTAKSRRAIGSYGHIHGFLSWWVPEFVEPLTKHSNFALVESGHLIDASRVRMIQKFEQYDMLCLQDRGMCGRLSTFLTFQEFAIVSLLCGTSEDPALAVVRDQHWPPKAGERLTVAGVLRREKDTFSRLLKSYGARETQDSNYEIVPVVRGK